ncbi:MAG TPA: glycerophosphodiester phosphodiesterase family protein [Kineosporiaceae bacterium]|jgi:glycerophosphoryl diester phosphodiesterase|nr:glycerophosphodiester phosphodiesterase family protein [Kineosporiaceae bacterium]
MDERRMIVENVAPSTAAVRPAPVVVPARGVLAGPRGYGLAAGPYAVAHRGGGGLATENTMLAFERSSALGIRYLETDVQITSDGVCVAFHDASLARMTGARARVKDLSWRELRGLRLIGGQSIPRLDEALEAFPDTRFTVDLKDPRGIGPLALTLRRTRANRRVCVAGSADRWLADVRAVMGTGVTTAMGWESLTRLATAARLGVRPVGVVKAPFAHVPLRLRWVPVFVDRLVAMAHDLGAQVLVWTVDDPGRMHRLLDAGVDGIISDRPDLLRDVLVSRGGWATSVA